MPQPWDVETDTTPALAARLIAQQFPHLAPVEIAPFSAGWDNIAFLVNEQYVFRFPRRTLGARLLKDEIRVMPNLAPLMPLAVPDHRFVGAPTDEFRWSFAGYRLIPGRTACRANLSTEQRRQIAPTLARFLH